MAQTVGRLTELNVRRAKKPRLYNDGGGLYLQIARNGSKSWIFRYGAQGRRYHGLGPLHAVSLSEAREKARECRRLLLQGDDPIAARRQRSVAARLEAAKNMSFAEAAAKYIKAHGAGWRNPKHRQQWTNTITAYVEPVIGKLPVAEIDTALVMRVLEPIWTTKSETASRVRMRVERILAWATVHGYRAGENPARWRGHLDHLLPPLNKVARVRHHSALPYSDVPSFLAEMRKRSGLAPKMLEFCILTAARTGEAVGAEWDEIDLKAGVWTVPGDRMKAGREHRVPLSDRAIEILLSLPAGARPNVFSLGDKAMWKLLARMKRTDVTVHGFRSSFRDWAAELTDYPNHVVEMALAHAVGDKVEAAYRRGDLFDKRRQLMNDWAAFCTSPRVVSVHRGAKRA